MEEPSMHWTAASSTDPLTAETAETGPQLTPAKSALQPDGAAAQGEQPQVDSGSPAPAGTVGTLPESGAELSAPDAKDGPAEQAAARSAQVDAEIPLTVSVPLAELRSLVLRAYPQAPPELVQGKTLAELCASAEQAVALRQRLLAEVAAPVAAGAPRQREPREVAHLSPLEKLRQALANRAG